VSASAAFPGAASLRAAIPLLAALAALSAMAPRAAAQDARRKQDILFPELPTRSVDDAPFDLAVKATSGLPVSLEVVSGPAVLDGKRIKLTGAPGLVIVRATQPGNDVFLAAVQAERAFTVTRRPVPPAIVSQPVGAHAAIGEIIALSVQATGEPMPAFQWRKDGVPVTGATDSRFTIASATPADAGAYDVVASNPLGSVSSERARVSVGKRFQTISFQGPANATSGQPLMLSANATSGLPVRFDVVSGAAILNGSMMTAQGGTVVIQASQPGDAAYEAAAPVSQTFVIGPGPNGPRNP
jgi:Ig-like domain-containing protein